MIAPQMKFESKVACFQDKQLYYGRTLTLLHDEPLEKGYYYLLQHWKPQHNEWKALVVGTSGTTEGMEHIQVMLDDEIIPKDVLGFGLASVLGHAIWEFDGSRMVVPN